MHVVGLNVQYRFPGFYPFVYAVVGLASVILYFSIYTKFFGVDDFFGIPFYLMCFMGSFVLLSYEYYLLNLIEDKFYDTVSLFLFFAAPFLLAGFVSGVLRGYDIFGFVGYILAQIAIFLILVAIVAVCKFIYRKFKGIDSVTYVSGGNIIFVMLSIAGMIVLQMWSMIMWAI